MKCTKCEACNNKEGINCAKYFGRAPNRFAFYGEMFGVEECKKGEPFVGKAGNILKKLLSSINMKKEDICVGNVCKCYIIGNKTPSKAILDACFIHTTRELREINPDFVIAMGASALYSLTGIPSEEFKYYRGKLIYSEKIKRKVFVTYHPAAVLYDKSKEKDIKKDFLKIPNLYDEELFEIKHYDYILVDSQSKFDDMYGFLLNKPMQIDSETEGLDMYNPNEHIRILQLGYKKNLYVIIPEIIYNNIDKLKILFSINKIIGQDFSFDAKWLFVKLGIKIINWWHDCCLAEYLISGMKNNDLNFLTGKYNPDYYGYWKGIPKGGSHLCQDKEKLYQYGTDDIGTLYPIYRKQQKTLLENEQYDYFRHIMMPCNRVLTEMSLRGVKIDLETLYKIDKKYKKKAQKVAFKAEMLPGIKECESHFKQKFNHSSTVMLRWLLLDYYKLPVLKRTNKSKTFPEGQAKVSQKEMQIYAEKHDNQYCKYMENYRSINTIRKNFLSGIVPKLKNGIAHTNYSLHATTTSRPNSKDPNLLNYPSKKEYKDIKKCLVARDGFGLLGADMKQIEVRVAAVIYYDKNLIDLCNTEGKNDFHSIITAKVHGVDYDDIYIPYENGDVEATDKRRICKAITFGILYQMGEEALAYKMGKSVKKARKFIDDYFAMFPDLKREIENIKKFVVENGYVDTYFGFRRFFKYHTWEDSNTLREAVNSPIQGTAWNLMQLSLININKILKENKMESGLNMQVYDQAIVEYEKSEKDEAARIMKNVIESVNEPYKVLNEVKIKTDLEIGRNVGELERYIE